MTEAYVVLGPKYRLKCATNVPFEPNRSSTNSSTVPNVATPMTIFWLVK